MKICILSMQRVLNFGSLLQSYSLKKILEQQGHTVSFLDIEPRAEDNRLLGGEANSFPQEGYSTGLLSKLRKLDRYAVNRVHIKWKAWQQNRKMDDFRTAVLGLNEAANKEHYDCCVIGSDEVFNCLNGAKWGFTSQLFGDVKQADRVITYAASCGATILEEIPAAAAVRIQESFQNISAFSVRDANTKRIVFALTEKPVWEHLDPVLIGDFEEEIKNAKLPESLPKKFCVVYSYYNRIHQKSEIEAIKAFCKKHDMEIVTVGAPQMWAKNHLVLNPFEVLRVFAEADFVITDTFHGTIFSAKYAKRFATITRDSNENKLGDLIERLGIQAHRVASFQQLSLAYSEIIDREKIKELCLQGRVAAIQYLKDNL